MDQRTGIVPLLFNHTQKALLVDVAIIKDIQMEWIRNASAKTSIIEKKVDKRNVREHNLADHLFIWQTRGESCYFSRSPWLALLSKGPFCRAIKDCLKPGQWGFQMHKPEWRLPVENSSSGSHSRLMRVMMEKGTWDVSLFRSSRFWSLWLWELQVWKVRVNGGCRGSTAWCVWILLPGVG